jgi:hypothetical protein
MGTMAGCSRDQIPVVARFPTPVQTGPGVCRASYTMSFRLQGSSGWGVALTSFPPPPPMPRLKERVELYFTPLLFLYGKLQGELYL